MDKCSISLEEGIIILFPVGLLGGHKRVAYIEPKIHADIEPILRTPEQVRQMAFVYYEVYAYKVRQMSKSLYYERLPIKCGFSVDHKISVRTCFLNKVSIEDAAHIDNLRVFDKAENIKKGKRNFIDCSNRWLAEKYGIEK